MTRDWTEHDDMLAMRYSTDARFHAIVKALENAASYGGDYLVVIALRSAERIERLFNDHA